MSSQKQKTEKQKTGSPFEPAHDLWRSGRWPLDAIFRPKTVGVIGATEREESVGRTVTENLLSKNFKGTVYPVNPGRKEVLGVKAYADIKGIPEAVDLAMIVTPAETVPDIIGACVEANVKGAIVISAGFKESGKKGVKLEDEIRAHLRKGRLRLIGPNCLGVMNASWGLNATFASHMGKTGKVAFISQSGALGTAVLDWSLKENIGFSAFVSIGSMLDVNWGDLIDYLGDDPNTQSILIYMESIGDARSFLSAAREVALSKPIIVIKAGRTEAASKAAASHTGALTGSDEVLEAAFRRCGVLRVNEISDLFSMAEVLARQPRPRGPRLAIVTNAGGPGVLATDSIVSSEGELAVLSQETVDQLNRFLPAHWSHGNPVDVLGDAAPERYARVFDVVAKDPQVDGILVILTPQAMTDPARTAECLKSCVRPEGKPVLASWMGGLEVEAGRKILTDGNIPDFDYPEMAARAFNYMWKYSRNLRSLYETPMLPAQENTQRRTGADNAGKLIASLREKKRTLMTEYEAKQILLDYGIETVRTEIAGTAEEAIRVADSIGYPVVLKLHSETITHKTDVGGVRLNLKSRDQVREAYEDIRSRVSAKDFSGVAVQPFISFKGYELIIGSSLDPQFGPVLLFGSGGELVEIFKDHALGLPPLNSTLARRMIERTRIYTALQGTRGRKPVDLDRLCDVMVLFSYLVTEHPRIKEIDINPLLVSSERIVALDARVVLHPWEIKEHDLPKPVIRPYPAQYAETWKMKEGGVLMIRPIRPEDEPLMAKFHKTLSEQTVHMRYFGIMNLNQRITHERLVRRCFNDYDREIALVAELADSGSGNKEIVAVGRLSKLHGKPEAEFAIVVSDAFQRRGLGTELLSRLVYIARKEGVSRLSAEMLRENEGMQRICRKLGFQILPSAEASVVKAGIDLEGKRS